MVPSLTPIRKSLGTLLAEAQSMPLETLQRRIQVAPLVMARRLPAERPGWAALFLKAMGALSNRHGFLRRLFVAHPRSHIYEHPVTIASVAVEREVENDLTAMFAHIRDPDNQQIMDLQRYFKKCQSIPLRDHSLFRRMLRMGAWPNWFRRFAWWSGNHWSGSRRARHFGTCSLSVVSGFGAVSPLLLSPTTWAVNYAPIETDGSVEVYFTFDQRVLTGSMAYATLTDLEAELNGALLGSLNG